MRKTNRKECDYNNYRTELAVRMQLSDISASYIICAFNASKAVRMKSTKVQTLGAKCL